MSWLLIRSLFIRTILVGIPCAAHFCDEPHSPVTRGSLYNVVGQSNSVWSAVPILGASLPPMPGEGKLG